ncbi:MAG: hypothetical protein JSS90_06180 [Bacteroidetes bacterium]|jgi:hypothetical protein|nr:hypothetical protein [Bacteroidota bacterium]
MIRKIKFCLLFVLVVSQLNVLAEDKSIYTLNWNQSDSYKVSGGKILSGFWEVRNDSSIFSSGNWLCNEKGNYKYRVDVTISGDGKLNSSDQAIIYIMKNENIAKAFVIKGNELDTAKNIAFEFDNEKSPVLKVNIVFKSLGSDRAWRLNDNAISITAISKDDDPEVKAIQRENACIVSWKSKTTEQTNYFIVERSANGTDFSQAGLVKAERNNQIAPYSFIDHTDNRLKNYYRILIKKFNGEETQLGNIISNSPSSDNTKSE